MEKFKQTEIGMIPEDWGVGELKDTALYITEKISLDEINLKNFISTENMLPNKGGITIASSLPKVGKVTQFKEGDILFSNIRTYFKKLWLAKFSGGCSNDVLVIRRKSSINNKYLYYFLSQDKFFEFTVLTSKGTKMPRGDKNAIMSYEVNIPTPLEQSAIAKILSDLDAKIELNQQMNKTLEAIGQAIFKQWFIDFEFPNEKGKPYKSSGGEMVDSELGKIPKGWKVKPIDEIANFLNGLALQKYPAKSEDKFLPVIKIRELKQGITDASDKASIDIPKEYVINDGDILFSWSGSLEVVIWTLGKGALNQHLFKVSSKDYPKWFYYYWVLEHLEEYRHIAEGKATTMGHIQRQHLKDSLVLIPDKQTIIKMDKILTLIIDKIIQINVGSRSLSQIRDSLLPKLMSGKIRVPVEVRA